MGWPGVVLCIYGLVTAVSAQCGLPTYSPYADQHILGGVLDSAATDLNACQTGCTNDASCFAVDVVLNPFRCYRLSDPTASLQPEVGTTHYRMWQACSADSNNCDYQAFSSFRFTTYYTEETLNFNNCAVKCNDLGNSCVAFSYQQTTNKCQLATSTAALTSASLQKDSSWKTMKKGKCTTNCNPFFAKKTDRSSANGMLQQGISTESGCKSACASNANCVGFDLDRSGSPTTCWIHESATNLANDRSTPGISQYVLIERCPQAACVPSYDKTLNTHSPYGVLEETSTTESSCKTACATDYYCLGFDSVYNSNTGAVECWIHRNQSNFSQKQTASGVNQYTLISRCPQGTVTQATTTSGGCTTTYVKKSGASSPYGQRISGSSSESDCKMACDARTDCVAIDLDLTGLMPSCWLHTAISDLNEQRSTPGIDQYVKTTNCPPDTTSRITSTTVSGGCQIRWDTRPSTSSVGATLETGITDLIDCQTRCINKLNCIAIDFNTLAVPAQCWLHFDVTKVNNKRSDPGVTQYILDRCYQGSTCQIKWQPLYNTKSYGAMLQSGLNNILDCQKACENKNTCVAVDFNQGTNPNQCWFHEDAKNLQNRVNDNDVIQYVLDRCYSDNCKIRWNNSTLTSSVGAMLQSSIRTLEACLNGCISQQSCVAVDYNFQASPEQCWFHDDINKVNAKRTDTQTNQYVLDRCYESQCPKFSEYENKHAIGGIRQNQVTTNDGCRQACLNSVDCQGYDFDSLISGCFIFNMANRVDNLLPQTGTNHYELLCRSGETLPPSAMPTTTRPAGTTTRWLGTTRTY